MKILVTGGSGFIGSHLIPLLERSHDVIAPRHSEVDFENEEEVASFFEEQSFSLVVHAASIGGTRKGTPHEDPLRGNLRMLFNLMQHRDRFDRMIFLGSGAEYDKSREIRKIGETAFGESIPSDDYGLAKYLCSLQIGETEGIVNLRMFGVIGEGEDYDIRPVSNLICRLLFGLPVELHQNMYLDYVDVHDLCRLILQFVDTPPSEKFYNVANGEHHDLLTLAEMIRDAAQSNVKIRVLNAGLNKEYTCDTTLLQKELPGFSFTPMKDVVRRLVNWYREHEKEIDTDKLRSY